MDSTQKRGARLLRDLGFTNIKFTGETTPHGSETLLGYTYADGSPVTDAPGVLVGPTGTVRLVPWDEVVFA